jgi:hypothetical protein
MPNPRLTHSLSDTAPVILTDPPSFRPVYTGSHLRREAFDYADDIADVDIVGADGCVSPVDSR